MDDTNAVVRRGMVASLAVAQVAVVGESSALRPAPRPDRINVLVFEADNGVDAALAAVRGTPAGLVATLRQPSGAKLHDLADRGVASILLLDELTPEVLVQTVRSVAAGGMTMSPALLRRLLDHVAQLNLGAAGSLSNRERQVLQMLADGEETRSIALGLNYSERTVKNVVHDVLTKLNCRTRAQAVGAAMRAGIL